MPTGRIKTSVMDAIKAILPRGCLYDPNNPDSEIVPNWEIPPAMPTDVFAVAAHLIYQSGLLNYFDPNPDMKADQNLPCSFTLAVEEKEILVNLGRAWAKDALAVRQEIDEYWECLLKWEEDALRASLYEKDNYPPLWWKAAISLLIIADEACAGVGLTANEDYWVAFFFYDRYTKSFGLDDKDGHKAERPSPSLTLICSDDVACILPKLRISDVGCTLRNLSKNLSYNPGAGTVRCHWQQPNAKPASDDSGFLKILLCPLPLEIDHTCFYPDSATKDVKDKWGNFILEQKWLNNENAVCIEIEKALISAKEIDGGQTVSAVMLPEYSITYNLFVKICKSLKLIEPGLEFLIAGSSTNCEQEKGNFVLTAAWYDEGETYILTSRRKHHRWKLDRQQLKSYGIETKLPPNKDWWEKHDIRQRELHFFQFRENSVFTSLICEDLARSDPCHEILRSVGPNLMFALLMDGPQLSVRWPGRYTATLTDDPGTSILTLTSFGLVKRANEVVKKEDEILKGEGKEEKLEKVSRSVAFWKNQASSDDPNSGEEKPLELKDDAYAILLTLHAETKHDSTIDGRKKENKIWQYNKHESISI
ncbi:MAG: hypothetical protein JKX94_02425 [Sneathiella sp.]|nr:hypothetical protein [Sneathiella sp.]